MSELILWIRSHKKLIGALLGAIAAAANTNGYPSEGHILELIGAVLFGGGLRSDGGVQEDRWKM